jgi:hypothetical protein
MPNNWYQEGLEGGIEVNKRQQEEAERRNSLPRRFWIGENKAGGTANTVLIFLDDKGFNVWEHWPFVPGAMDRQFTCVLNIPGSDGKPRECIGCQKQIWKRNMTFFTVIDTGFYEGTQRNYVNEKKLLSVPAKMVPKFAEWKKRESEALGWKAGSLLRRKMSVSRTASSKDSLGDMWEPVPEPPVSLEALVAMKNGEDAPVDPTPFDYMEILKPLPDEKILEMVQGHISKYAKKKGTTAGSPGEGSVPF